MKIKDFVRKILRVFQLEIRKSSNTPISLIEYLNPTLVLDIGANSGQFAKSIRQNGYCEKIVSFEPLASAHYELQESASKDEKWIVWERCGLGDSSGDLEINRSENSVSSSFLEILDTHMNAASDSYYVNKELVKVIKLDDIFMDISTDDDVVYLKIDTQGFEKKVLDGSVKSLASIRAVQLELSLVELYKGQMLFDYFFDFLFANGFELWSLEPVFRDLKTGQLLQFDGYFIKRVNMEFRT